eukprot:SM000002S05661  [mRNA]  locus=s2:1451786:1454966:- [translate_table: standard]
MDALFASYALHFLVATAGIASSLAGTMLMLSELFSVGVGVLASVAIEASPVPRAVGKHRFWILLAVGPLFASFSALWWPPAPGHQPGRHITGFDSSAAARFPLPTAVASAAAGEVFLKKATIAYYLAALLAFNLFYGTLIVAYEGSIPMLASDPLTLRRINVLRLCIGSCSSVAAILVVAVVHALVGDAPSAYLIQAAVVGGVVAALFLLWVLLAEEHEVPYHRGQGLAAMPPPPQLAWRPRRRFSLGHYASIGKQFGPNQFKAGRGRHLAQQLSLDHRYGLYHYYTLDPAELNESGALNSVAVAEGSAEELEAAGDSDGWPASGSGALQHARTAPADHLEHGQRWPLAHSAAGEDYDGGDTCNVLSELRSTLAAERALQAAAAVEAPTQLADSTASRSVSAPPAAGPSSTLTCVDLVLAAPNGAVEGRSAAPANGSAGSAAVAAEVDSGSEVLDRPSRDEVWESLASRGLVHDLDEKANLAAAPAEAPPASEPSQLRLWLSSSCLLWQKRPFWVLLSNHFLLWGILTTTQASLPAFVQLYLQYDHIPGYSFVSASITAVAVLQLGHALTQMAMGLFPAALPPEPMLRLSLVAIVLAKLLLLFAFERGLAPRWVFVVTALDGLGQGALFAAYEIQVPEVVWWAERQDYDAGAGTKMDGESTASSARSSLRKETLVYGWVDSTRELSLSASFFLTGLVRDRLAASLGLRVCVGALSLPLVALCAYLHWLFPHIILPRTYGRSSNDPKDPLGRAASSGGDFTWKRSSANDLNEALLQRA